MRWVLTDAAVNMTNLANLGNFTDVGDLVTTTSDLHSALAGTGACFADGSPDPAACSVRARPANRPILGSNTPANAHAAHDA